MFRRRDRQRSFLETEYLVPPAKRARLERTWAHTFREKALPLIDEDLFAPLFHESNGRPNVPVQIIVGILLLKEMFDLTDAGALEQVEFNLAWQHALRLTPDEAHACQKTLHNFRIRMIEHDQGRLLFESLTQKILEELGIEIRRQRLDSTRILSNIKILTRLGLLCETIRVFLSRLRKQDPGRFAEVPTGLCSRYLKDSGEKTAYGDAKSSEGRRRIAVCARDLYRLVDRFKGTEVAEFKEYGLVKRLLEEQCEVVEEEQAPKDGDDDADDGRVPVVLKDAKEISGDSLQSPHDADATYSGHKGKGYDVQVSETTSEGNDVEIITHVEVTPACESDANSTIPITADLKEKGLQPEELLADTTYGSAQNAIEAGVMGTELVSPTGGSAPKTSNEGSTAAEPTAASDEGSTAAEQTAAGDEGSTAAEPTAAGDEGSTAAEPTEAEKKPLSIADFEVSLDAMKPARCPKGQEATRRESVPGKGPRVLLTFAAARCAACPFALQCPVKVDKSAGVPTVIINLKHANLERRRRLEASGEFKKRYDARAGVEATMSELKRGHGLGKVRVRGSPRVRLAVYLKSAACNLKRMGQALLARSSRPPEVVPGCA